jgi:hypothetical protein
MFGNGILRVYVVNELTVPNSTVDNTVSVNVFVSAGDDFEVANPDDDALKNYEYFLRVPPTILDAQSSESAIPQSDHENTSEPSVPMQTQITNTLGSTTDRTDPMMHVHYGEEITSFRQCLKRYNLHSVAGVTRTGPTWYWRRANNLPYHRGRAPGAIHDASSSAGNYKYNYSQMTLLNYLLPAFTGYRGSTRWKFLTFGGDNSSSGMLMATRVSVSGSYIEAAVDDTGTADASVMHREALVQLPHTWPGSHATATGVNPALEVEFPYYSNFRFGLAKEADLTSSTYNDWFHDVRWNLNVPAANGSPARMANFVSVGEDFGLYFFTGAPLIYYNSWWPSTPTASSDNGEGAQPVVERKPRSSKSSRD